MVWNNIQGLFFFLKGDEWSHGCLYMVAAYTCYVVFSFGKYLTRGVRDLSV